MHEMWNLTELGQERASWTALLLKGVALGPALAVFWLGVCRAVRQCAGRTAPIQTVATMATSALALYVPFLRQAAFAWLGAAAAHPWRSLFVVCTLLCLLEPSVSVRWAAGKWPLIGHWPVYLWNKRSRLQWQLAQGAGAWALWLPGFGVVVHVNSAQHVRTILSAAHGPCENDPRKPASLLAALSDYTRGEIISLEGEAWRTERATLMRFFHHDVQREASHRFQEAVDEWTRHGPDSPPRLCAEDVPLMVLDGVCRAVFGASKQWRTLHLRNLHTLLGSIHARLYDRLYEPWELQKRLGLHSERRLRAELCELDTALEEADAERDAWWWARDLASEPPARRRAMLLALLVGGAETTGATLQWMLAELAHQPALQDIVHCAIVARAFAAREEADEVARARSSALASNTPASAAELSVFASNAAGTNDRAESEQKGKTQRNGRDVVAEDIACGSVLALEQVIAETLRLHPGGPSNARVLRTADMGTVASVSYPWPWAGRCETIVEYSPWVMARLNDLDGAVFCPSRWASQRAQLHSVRADQPTFALGPRVCPGREMAWRQLRQAAAAIIRGYRVCKQEATFHPPAPAAGLFLLPSAIEHSLVPRTQQT